MAKPPRRFWLFKSEPDVYGFAHFQKDGRTQWTGVRNYQARNLLRDEIHTGDLVLYYHSNAEPTAIVGIARVSKDAWADETQFDPKSPYYDPKATREAPRWFGVEIVPVAAMPRPVDRDALKGEPALADMMVLQRGARLSVQPVDAAHFRKVCEMGMVTVPS
jgi:predicted RNA-binding protein with PUA-like domain